MVPLNGRQRYHFVDIKGLVRDTRGNRDCRDICSLREEARNNALYGLAFGWILRSYDDFYHRWRGPTIFYWGGIHGVPIACSTTTNSSKKLQAGPKFIVLSVGGVAILNLF